MINEEFGMFHTGYSHTGQLSYWASIWPITENIIILARMAGMIILSDTGQNGLPVCEVTLYKPYIYA